MNWTKGEYTISTDRSLLDLDTIHGFLKTSYWANERSREQIECTIENSICFGLYKGDRQIGFARIVTDEAAISWLGDVFVLPEFQRNGLGKWLVQCVTEHPIVKQTRCLLGTQDAHGLYEQYGWERREMMFRPEDGSG